MNIAPNPKMEYMQDDLPDKKEEHTELAQTQQDLSQDPHKLKIDNIELQRFPTSHLKGSRTTLSKVGGSTSTKIFKSLTVIP